MRRIGRYILNGLTVLSLVLCLATVGLWVQSRWRSITASWTSRDSKAQLQSAHGQLSFELYRPGAYRDAWWILGRGFDVHVAERVLNAEDEERYFDLGPGTVYHREAFGFSVYRAEGGRDGFTTQFAGWRLAVPDWFPALFLLVAAMRRGRSYFCTGWKRGGKAATGENVPDPVPPPRHG